MPARCRWRCGATRWRAPPNASSRSRNSARPTSAGLVGTVGYINALPGATNVIPGQVSFTLDIRAPTDAHRKLAVADIVRRIEAIAKRRELSLQIDVTHENRTVPCAPWLKAQVAEAVAAEGYGVFELPSGAGHDGMAMIDIADVAMLFVRCRGGISHHPAEHVEPDDADAGARVLLRLIENFRPRDGQPLRRMGRAQRNPNPAETDGYRCSAHPASLYDKAMTVASHLAVRRIDDVWSTTDTRHHRTFVHPCI